MRILVIGGAGFIGSNLCALLSKNKLNKVTSLDNYFTGREDNHLENVEYIYGDASQISHLVSPDHDLIFHFGEYSRVEQSFEDIDLVMDYNRAQTIAVLEFWRKHKCKLVYSGSSTKFADGGIGPTQSPYAFTKASNTELVKNYSNWYNLEYAIVYFYNAYGPNEIGIGRYATLIEKYRSNMANGLPLDIVAPGTQERNFTHVRDIVSALEMVGLHGGGDNFGIGSPEKYTVEEVATMFGGEKRFIPERRGNRLSASLETQRTLELGWKPTTRLPEYIHKLRTNNWQRQFL